MQDDDPVNIVFSDMFLEPEVAAIEKRCDLAHIEYGYGCEGDVADTLLAETLLVVLKGQHSDDAVTLETLAELRLFAALPFESYAVLNSYAAYVDCSRGFIEALANCSSPQRLIPESIRSKGGSAERLSEIAISVQHSHEPVTVALKSRTPESHLLLSSGDWNAELSLIISGLRLANPDHAQEVLENISGSFFFEMNRCFGLDLRLARHVEPSFYYKPSAFDINRVKFPTSQYDPIPLHYYSFGCSAEDMPLIQFLAFYQVIEYYFPRYRHAELCRRAFKVLSDPEFTVEHPEDASQLVAIISDKDLRYSSESGMLRATLEQCINPRDLYDFIRLNGLQSHLSGETGHSAFLPVSVPSASEVSVGLCHEVSRRVYNIRCAIVHSKAPNDDRAPASILPYSPEADILSHDVSLIAYLAEQVLISSGVPLSLDEHTS